MKETENVWNLNQFSLELVELGGRSKKKYYIFQTCWLLREWDVYCQKNTRLLFRVSILCLPYSPCGMVYIYGEGNSKISFIEEKNIYLYIILTDLRGVFELQLVLLPLPLLSLHFHLEFKASSSYFQLPCLYCENNFVSEINFKTFSLSCIYFYYFKSHESFSSTEKTRLSSSSSCALCFKGNT